MNMKGSESEQLVREAMELVGAAPPALLQDDAPVLHDAVVSAAEGGMYLVGLIGGKEVGKSALVNALVGASITPQTSHGPGTETVIAYAHQSQRGEIEALLAREVPGRYRIVPHANDRLARQVLLDLPDIDSRFVEHVELTRKMLRHMLFPIWMQSVEKYADVQPQNLLAKVAAGNDPANFLFCLNKADQVNDNGAAIELRDDYAARVGRVLKLSAPPRVYLISAIHPEQFDLPELSKLLSREKSTQLVSASRDLAGRQRERSLLRWLGEQNLTGRAQEMGRLAEEASELAAQRIGVPLLEVAVPAMLEDSDYRAVMTDGVLANRVARWPLVNVVHAILSPLRLVVRENISSSRPGLAGAEALIDAHLHPVQGSVATLVQTTFAQLHQSHQNIASLYENRRLWETMDAELAETRLRTNMAETIRRQRSQVMDRLAGRRGVIAPLLRFTLTIGALLWFPFIQPILAEMLKSGSWTQKLPDAALLAVTIFSTPMLLQNAAFLLLWYLFLWGWLLWDTRRRVDRLLSRWMSAEQPDPSLNLTTQTLDWLEDLLEPIRAAHERLASLVTRIEVLKRQIDSKKDAA
jgi:GTPase Era involved in 16S rRNA processing